MSPGNLYYHFKGKDPIISALFDRLLSSLAGFLSAPLSDPTLFGSDDDSPSIEQNWLFLTVVFEEMLAYRFVYENLVDLMHRYPNIERGMRKLLKLKHAACLTIGYDLVGEAMSGRSDQRMVSLADAMTMNLTYWLSYEQLTDSNRNDTATVHRGVLQTLSYCAPYLGDDQSGFFDECEQMYSQMIAS